MMNWKTLSIAKAGKITQEWVDAPVAIFNEMKDNWSNQIEEELKTVEKEDDNEYVTLRRKLLESYDYVNKTIKVTESAKGKEDYYFDLLFGLEVYRIFNELGMNVRYASMTELWIFMNIKVIPDIVYKRFCKKTVFVKNSETNKMIRKIPEDRYWRVNRRVYLKQLWWYIHLSAQFTDGEFDSEKTFEVLKLGTTDTIAQLVERSGKFGYRVDVSRKLMQKISTYIANCHRAIDIGEFFRGVMVLMTARTPVVEPAFANINSENAVSMFLDEIINTNKRGLK